jgi:hypothetical protein
MTYAHVDARVDEQSLSPYFLLGRSQVIKAAGNTLLHASPHFKDDPYLLCDIYLFGGFYSRIPY